MRKLLLFTSIIFAGQTVHAQALLTKTGLRFYEHHSAAIAGPKGANPSQSGYDFVNNKYSNSFDSTTFGPHTDGTDTTIDMVEHNGQFGNNQNFGFTSGVSSIWQGDIQGNGTTMWMEAPVSFNYAAVTDVNQLKTAYNPSLAAQAIVAVKNNTVYIGRIRNTDLYVAMRCYNLTNKVAFNTYFDFDYKYGVWNPNTTSVNDLKSADVLNIYPNPAKNQVTVSNIIGCKLSVKIMSLTGQQIKALTLNSSETMSVDLNHVSEGLYVVVCSDENGKTYTSKLVKQ